MKNKAQSPTFQSRAAEVRRIAEGIFDHKERRSVLRFVAEYEKVSKTKAAD